MSEHGLSITLRADRLPVIRRADGSRSNPYLPRKNRHWKPFKNRMILSEQGREFRCAMASFLGAELPDGARTATRYKTAKLWAEQQDPAIKQGHWQLHLTVFCARQASATDGPYIDSDACLAPVRDALEFAGVIDNDMRIREDHTRTEYRKGEPGLVIELRRLDA